MAEIQTNFYPQLQQGNSLLGMAGEAAQIKNLGVQNQLLNTDSQLQQMNLHKEGLNNIVGAFSSIAADPNASYARFHQLGQALIQDGVAQPEQVQTELQGVLPNQPPAYYQGIAKQFIGRILSPAEQYGAANGYGPGQGAQPINVPATDANGQPTGATATIPLSQFAGGQSQNPLAAPPSSASSEGANPLTGAPANASSPTAAAAPVPLAPPQQKYVSATPQQLAQFQASGAQQQADVTADANYTANLVPLQKVAGLLPDVPLFGTGAEIPTQVAKVLATFGVPQAALQSKDSSELEKYLASIARSSGAAPNAVAQLEAAITANPNMSSDRYAAKDVVGTMMALARLQHAKVAAAQAQGVAPEQYSNWSSKWSAQQDPRAYAFDFMDAKAKSALKAELQANPGEAQKFINSYQAAKAAGIFGQ